MKNLDDILEQLYKSQSENDVILNLKIIIKGFNVKSYIDIIRPNVYFYGLIKDIKGDILIEISSLKKTIESEISVISDAMMDIKEQKEFDRLKELKRECIRLLYEVNDRINDIILI